MSEPTPPPVGKRVTFSDNENKVLAKDFGELVDSTPINNAVQEVGDTALAAMQSAKTALEELQQVPAQAINQALASGKAASEMLDSVSKTISANTPDLRSISATLSAVASGAQQQASELTQSVMGSVNSALAQVPAAIGKISQISADVKTQLLKSSVAQYASSAAKTVQDIKATATHALNAVSQVSQGIAQVSQQVSQLQREVGQFQQTASRMTEGAAQAVRSITASKQLFAPVYIPPVQHPQATASSTTAKRILSAIENPAGVKSLPEVGTSSKLLPVSSTFDSYTPTTHTPVTIEYTDHALVTLMGAVSWYRSLYSSLFLNDRPLTHLSPIYGQAQDHYAVLTLQGSELQKEQLQSFNILVKSNTPDNPSKNLYAYRTYQTLLGYLVSDLSTFTNNSVVSSVTAHISQLLSVVAIKPLLTEEDYDTIAAKVSTCVQAALTDRHNLPNDQYTPVFTDYFLGIVTDAIVAHRGTGSSVQKRVEASSEIALYCAVWLCISFLQAWTNSKDAAQRSRLIKALQVLSSVPLDTMEYPYADYHGLVLQGALIYYTPSAEAFYKLPYPLIKHYMQNRDAILKSSIHLSYNKEEDAFNAITKHLDSLIELNSPEIQAIVEDDSPIDYLSLSESHLALGTALSHSMIRDKRLITEVFGFPSFTFEAYYASTAHLYFDRETAMLR